MCGQEEEDALIVVLKSLVGKCTTVYAKKGVQIETSSNGTNEVQEVSFIAKDDIQDEDGILLGVLPCQLAPKELSPRRIGKDRVLFDMDGGVYHSKIPVEKVYMANSVQEEEYFNPLEIEDDVFSYESLACLLFEQCTQSCDNESINTLHSFDNMQELEVKHEDVVRNPNLKRRISRWHVCKHVRVFYDNECGKDCGMWPTCNPDFSFCSGYDVIYGKGEN
ncbi:hypothetical protein Tco_0603232 [Tanacetum coccineum]